MFLCYRPRHSHIGYTTQKNRPRQINLCQGRVNTISPRCHLDSCYDSMLFQDTNISPATDVCARHEILSLYSSAFPHALSGPFNSLHFQPFSASGLSVSASTVFISTSTVCVPLLIFYYVTLSLIGCQVFFHLNTILQICSLFSSYTSRTVSLAIASSSLVGITITLVRESGVLITMSSPLFPLAS